MKSELLINEVFWLRSIACLAVTLGHAFNNGYIFFTEPSIYHSGVYILNMAILFGVPVFVFISEFLLSNKYSLKVPEGFLKKRVKVLLLPYLFMSVVYALTSINEWTLKEVLKRISTSVFLGESPVYFILIIFQFYFLHMLLSKYLNRISAKIIIPLAFIINFLYLAFFNFTDSPNSSIGNFIWSFGYWLPFIGWIFYFVLGFYCGKNYHAVLALLRNKWVLIIPFLALILMLFVNKYFLIDQDSKRVDMLIYASSIIFLAMHISTKIKRVPRVVMFISNYSFSVFLVHMFYFWLLSFVEPPAFLNILTYSFSSFLFVLLLSIGTAFLFNKFSIGKYFVGGIMPFRTESKGKQKDSKNLAL